MLIMNNHLIYIYIYIIYIYYIYLIIYLILTCNDFTSYLVSIIWINVAKCSNVLVCQCTKVSRYICYIKLTTYSISAKQFWIIDYRFIKNSISEYVKDNMLLFEKLQYWYSSDYKNTTISITSLHVYIRIRSVPEVVFTVYWARYELCTSHAIAPCT